MTNHPTPQPAARSLVTRATIALALVTMVAGLLAGSVPGTALAQGTSGSSASGASRNAPAAMPSQAVPPTQQAPAGGGSASTPHPGGRPSLSSLQAFVDSLSAPQGYVRETFAYPRFGRQDPVTPPRTLLVADAFPSMTLSGILYRERRPEQSTAMVRLPNRTPFRRVLRAGDTVDQYTVVRIERTRVVLDKHRYGGTERVYLTLTSNGVTENPDAESGRKAERAARRPARRP